jgi:hypothetical protein
MASAPKVLGRDLREVQNDIRPVFGATVDDLQSRLWTAFPIEFVEFDKEKQTAKIKPLIKTTRRKEDGTTEKQEIPEIEDAPVYFPSGGRKDDQQQGSGTSSGLRGADSGGGGDDKKGYMLTFPIKKGDEGIAIVSSRSFDLWYDKSGAQEQGDARMHHLSDIMILPGVKSKKRAKEVKDGVDDKGVQLRSVNGKHKYGVDENEDGGLYSKTSEHIKNAADKNVENEAGKDMTTKAGENHQKETGKVDSSKAGKAIVKTAPKILLNST